MLGASTMIQKKWTAVLVSTLWVAFSTGSSSSQAGDLSGTYLDPALQRPDFFSHHLWNSWPEYRAVYNRPRYIGGHLAAVIEPSSQEAMSWRENVCNGNYQKCRGPHVPHYYYLKPWEALNTKARNDNKPQIDTIKLNKSSVMSSQSVE